MQSNSPNVPVLPHTVRSDDERRVVAMLEEAEPLVIGDPVRARALLRVAMTEAVALGADVLRAHALCLMGGTSYFLCQFEEALDVFRSGCDLARSLSHRAIEARCLNGLAMSFQKLGDYGNAMTHYLDSLKLAQEIGDEAGRVRAMSNIARVHGELGEYEQALELHIEAIRTADRVGLAIYRAAAAVNAVADYYKLRRYDEALRLAEETLGWVRANGWRQYEGELLSYRALTLLDTGRTREALEVCEQALPLTESVGDRDFEAAVLTVRGRALWALGHTADAVEAVRRALTLAHQISAKVREAEAHRVLSDMLEAHGDYRTSLTHARAYHELERTIHAEDVARKTKVLSAQVKVELLRREAETERVRNVELASANEALRQAREQLEHQALHDALTGLANRVNFERTLQHTLDETTRESIHAVLFVDLDRFKHVNDTLGHDAGDELLRQVARRLRRCVRATDLVARMGGDEFTLLLHDLSGARDAELIADKLLAALAAPFDVANTPLFITASVGIAVAPRDGTDVGTLQKHADVAMYRAKHEGKNAVRAYEPSMSQETERRVDLERDLREALDHQQFELHYQPQFHARTGDLAGFEALLRWRHPRLGLVPPGQFIPIAEESGLIVPLGAWVLREAVRQAQLWASRAPDLTMSVNVSPRQLAQENFPEVVRDTLSASGLPAGALVLELTESTVMADAVHAASVMERLRRGGVRVAMDDFGTGHSSMSLLQHLPIDHLKVDRSFLRLTLSEQDGPRRAGVMLAATLMLARGLDLTVTVEGVETREQWELLRSLDCHYAQGFHLGRPMPASEVERTLWPDVRATGT